MTQDTNDFDFALSLSFVWRWRKKIVVTSFVIAFVALLYAYFSTPIYKTDIIIAPKESQRSISSSGMLSQLGGFGGMMATQLGIAGSSLEKMEVIARGNVLIEKIIVDNNLLQEIFPKTSIEKPSEKNKTSSNYDQFLRKGVDKFKKQWLSISKSAKSNTLTITIYATSAELAFKTAENYLTALNYTIRDGVISESYQNRLYLEQQLNTAIDPILKDKIQNLIASEFEKSMLMNSQAFEILDKPVLPLYPVKPKKKLIVIITFLSSFAICIFTSILWGYSHNFRYSLTNYLKKT